MSHFESYESCSPCLEKRLLCVCSFKKCLSQIPVHLNRDALLKLCTVNTSVMMFYTDPSIPVERAKIPE